MLAAESTTSKAQLAAASAHLLPARQAQRPIKHQHTLSCSATKNSVPEDDYNTCFIDYVQSRSDAQGRTCMDRPLVGLLNAFVCAQISQHFLQHVCTTQPCCYQCKLPEHQMRECQSKCISLFLFVHTHKTDRVLMITMMAAESLRIRTRFLCCFPHCETQLVVGGPCDHHWVMTTT